jgi:hypothetical protein
VAEGGGGGGAEVGTGTWQRWCGPAIECSKAKIKLVSSRRCILPIDPLLH